MKSLAQYINEKKRGGYMWLTTGDGRIEIYVTKEDFDKGVAVYMVKDQMKKYSDDLILYELNETGCDYKLDDFKNREKLIATFLEYYDDEYWEEDDAPITEGRVKDELFDEIEQLVNDAEDDVMGSAKAFIGGKKIELNVNDDDKYVLHIDNKHIGDYDSIRSGDFFDMIMKEITK